MLPSYRYYTRDILTGQVLGELPLYGVYMDKKISAAGNFTGTYRLDTKIHNDDELLSSTIPQRTEIYCERNGSVIWGGILWSRTYNSQADTVQLSAQTFESYPAVVVCLTDFKYATPTNQLQIAKALFDKLQNQDPRSDIGIDTSQVDTSGGIAKTIEVFGYDNKRFSDILSELGNAENGFEWTISVGSSTVVDQPTKTLILGQPSIAVNTPQNAIVYDYPGTVASFYWPESGSKTGTDFIILGNGSGSEMLRSIATWQGSEAYPQVHQIFSRKDIANQVALNNLAQAIAAAYGPAISNPTITLESSREPEFDGWNALGAFYRLELEAPRFPERKILTKRMIGWQLNVASSEQMETVTMVLEGDENAS